MLVGGGRWRTEAAQAVCDVQLLFAVVAQRHPYERAARRDELHRGGQAALHDGEVAAREPARQVFDEAGQRGSLWRGDRGGIDSRAADGQQLRFGDVLAQQRERLDHSAQQRRAAGGAADRGDHERRSGTARGGLEAAWQHVAGEREALCDPFRDRWEAGSERAVDDVFGLAEEEGGVAHPGVALDLLDHLGVVVGDQRCLVFVHRQPADEVGQEGVRARS